MAKEGRPETITPAVEQAVPGTTGGYPKLSAPTLTARIQNTLLSTVSSGARLVEIVKDVIAVDRALLGEGARLISLKVGRIVRKNSLTARIQNTRPSTVSSGARLVEIVKDVIAVDLALLGEGARLISLKVGRMVRKNSLSLALGAGAGIVLIAAFAASLLMQQTFKGPTALSRAAVAVQATVNAPIPTDITTPTAITAAKETDVAQRQTDEAQARSAAATGTAALGATATQLALNASAAQPAVGFRNCDTMDFEILESPVDLTSVTSSAANIEFTWRVRNKASLPYCKWGQEGQETRLVRAIEVGGRLGTSVPAKLKWIDNDEYTLSLTARLGLGQYSLSWRLLLPKTNSPGGPELRATAIVLAATPTRAPTLVPPTLVPPTLPALTSTTCPEKVYSCNCRKECSGRDCTTVCEECTKPECGK